MDSPTLPIFSLVAASPPGQEGMALDCSVRQVCCYRSVRVFYLGRVPGDHEGALVLSGAMLPNTTLQTPIRVRIDQILSSVFVRLPLNVEPLARPASDGAASC